MTRAAKLDLPSCPSGARVGTGAAEGVQSRDEHGERDEADDRSLGRVADRRGGKAHGQRGRSVREKFPRDVAVWLHGKLRDRAWTMKSRTSRASFFSAVMVVDSCCSPARSSYV